MARVPRENGVTYVLGNGSIPRARNSSDKNVVYILNTLKTLNTNKNWFTNKKKRTNRFDNHVN